MLIEYHPQTSLSLIKRLEMFVCQQTSQILLLVWIKHKMTTYFQKHGSSDI